MARKVPNVEYKFYGQNVALLLNEATKIKDPDKKEDMVIHIGRLMKTLYVEWNRDNVEDETIAKHIKELSGGALSCNLEKVKEHNLFRVQARREHRGGAKGGGTRNRSGGGNRNHAAAGKQQNNRRRHQS